MHMWTIVGLGNPGGEYDNTRHNIGRDLLRAIAKSEGIKEWKDDSKTHAQLTRSELFGKKVTLVLPDTYMNNSGKALTTLVKSKKDAEQLVVVHDELDLPLGKIKFSVVSL